MHVLIKWLKYNVDMDKTLETSNAQTPIRHALNFVMLTCVLFHFCANSVVYLYSVFLPPMSIFPFAYKGCGVLGPVRFDVISGYIQYKSYLQQFIHDLSTNKSH
jgi:hypothetical protein